MNDLSPLYAGWMRAAAGEDVPRETVATCGTCVMLPPEGDLTPAKTTFFGSATKCCTFLPEMHNFLVGGVLDDATNHPLGTASLERRIDAGVEVTPLGLGRARSFLLLYDDGGDAVFGRADRLRCPHYIDEQGGLCGVWRHRESTCSTWFCKHTRGATGHDIWRAIQRVLRLAEVDLAWWCVRELGLDAPTLGALLDRQTNRNLRRSRVTASDIDGTRDGAYEQLWGTFAGREREFFRACGEKVRALTWHDVLNIGGPDVVIAADHMRSLVVRARANELPERLKVATFAITTLRDEHATITTYNAYDALMVPVALIDALDAFDGRETQDVLDELARDRDVELEPALVQRLVDFGVLEAVGKAST